MKPPPSLLALALIAGCPLWFAAAAELAKVSEAKFGLTHWTYRRVDDNRIPTSKKKGSFGIAFGDVDGDGFVDIASGAHFYRNPGGDMLRARWPRTDLPPDPKSGATVDAGLLFSATGNGPPRDIIAEALPNIIWLHTGDAKGETWTAKVVAQMPAPRHGNGRTIKMAWLTPGARRPDILLTGGGGTYLLKIPDQPEAGNWPITRITHTEADEQKAIGVGDIDRDGHLDLVLPAGIKLPQVEWWRNPGDGSANWVKHAVGSTINMSKMVDVADVDNDGRLDVIATDSENVDSGLFWFGAPSDPFKGEWTRHDIAKGYNGLDSMSVADMNGDGRPDIVIGETKDQLRLVIYENIDGGKSWKEHVIDRGKESHKGANAVDLDGDGDLDLVSIAYFGFKDLHIWRHDSVR